MDSGINVNVHSLLYFLRQNTLQGLLHMHTHRLGDTDLRGLSIKQASHPEESTDGRRLDHPHWQ